MEILIAAVILTEALTQYGKTIAEMFKAEDKSKGIYQLITILIGLFIAFSLENVNLFTIIGITANPIVAKIITGILISRGSNWCFDFFKRIREPISTVG